MTNAQTTGKGNIARKGLGFGYFIAAVIFLCNPILNIIDILPDFFGYCFLIAGLAKWADLCPGISEAVRGLSRLRWIMLIKLFCILLIPLVDKTFVLVFTFSFTVIEALYVFPAIGRIFDGFEYFGTRFSGKSVFRNIKNTRFLTNLLFALRYILVLLPELCELSSFEYSGYVTSGVQINIANYKNLLIIVNVFLCLLAAIVWLINVIPYISRIKRDKPFIERIKQSYNEEIASNVGLGISRKVRAAFTLIIVSSVFLPNIWIDGVNIIPSFVGGIFLAIAALKLVKLNGTGKITVLAPVLYTVVSAASYAVSLKFGTEYTFKDITRDFTAYDLYNAGLIVSAFEYALLAVSALLVWRQLVKLMKTHLAPGSNIADSRLSDIQSAHYKESQRSVTLTFVFFAVALIVNAAYVMLRAEIAAAFYLAAFAISAIWIVAAANTVNRIYGQIEYKYM